MSDTPMLFVTTGVSKNFIDSYGTDTERLIEAATPAFVNRLRSSLADYNRETE